MGTKNCEGEEVREISQEAPSNVNIVNNRNRTTNSVSFMYTNADSLRNKFNEFQIRVRNNKPKIIGVTEVKAKKNIYKHELFGIQYGMG